MQGPRANGSLTRLVALLTALILPGAVAAETLAGVAPDTGSVWSPGIWLLASAIVFIDLIDFLVRIAARAVQTLPDGNRRVAPTSIPLEIGAFTPYQVRLHIRPWAIVASVHNLGAGTGQFVLQIGQWREHVYVIDDASTDDTIARLRAAGIQVIEGLTNRHKPGAIRELLRHLPNEIETLLVIDPDCEIHADMRPDDGIERVIFEFQRSGMAAACPRLTLRPDGWLVTVQRLEYAMSFSLGRKSLGDNCITSGIAIWRRDALASVLAAHTLSVYAEDLENALRTLARGRHIYYDGRLRIETEGKRDLRGWFSQRVGWSYGLAKVYVEQFPQLWRFARKGLVETYQFIVYLGVFSLLFHPLKLASAAVLSLSAANGLDLLFGTQAIADTPLTNPWLFPLAYAKYTLLAIAALHACVPRAERPALLPVACGYFVYVILHLIPATVGYLNWLALRLTRRRLYRDHYASDAHLVTESARHRS